MACKSPISTTSSTGNANKGIYHSYRITSFSIHLSPPVTWHTVFTLSRIPNQPSLLPALHIPTSDQLDDWKDYQRLKLIDRGEDFAMLHEILAQPAEVGANVGLGEGYSIRDERQGSEDSGYFSRRGSKTTTSTGDVNRDSVLTEAMEGIIEDYEGAEGAGDEGADLRGPEEENDRARTKHIYTKHPFQTRPADHHHSHPHPHTPHQEQSRIPIASRFLSPATRRPASPLVSADETVVSRTRARDQKGASI